MTNESYEHDKWVFETKKSDAVRAHDVETEFGNKINEAAINAGNASQFAAAPER